MSNWLGLPYPPRRLLRCDPYRISLGSLRAYYYNPNIITISQSYCSLCMPKATGGMLRFVVLKSWNQTNIGKITGTKCGYTLSITEDALSELKGLEQPDPPLLTSSLFHQPSKVTQLIVDRHGCREKNKIESKVAQLVESPDKCLRDLSDIAHTGSSRREVSSIMRCPVSCDIELERRQARVNILGMQQYD